MAKAGLDYTIKVNIDSSNATKGEKALLNTVRRMNSDLTKQRNNTDNLRIIRKKLREEVNNGNMTSKEAARLLNRERQAHNRLMQRKRASVKTTRDNTTAINAETRAYQAQQRAIQRTAEVRARHLSMMSRERSLRSARMAQMGAAGVSGLGMGGAVAGGARFMALGGAGGMGMMAGLGGAYLGVAGMKASFTAAAELEDGLMSLEVMFGKVKAQKLGDEFRELARTTALTTEGIIGSAKIWSSYGNTTEGITDRMKRIGDVTFGNSEKMKLLTTALAQVNAQTKLMGQEKLQLVNAGFSLQAVADAAGISMANFSKEMEKGNITAEHVNQALINLTNEGGLFYKGLEKGATTMNGKLGLMNNAWKELGQTIGGSLKEGVFVPMIDMATGVATGLDKALQLANKLAGFDPDANTEQVLDSKGRAIYDPSYNRSVAGKYGIQTDMASTTADAASRTRGARVWDSGASWFTGFFDQGIDPYSRRYNNDAMRAMAENNEQYGMAQGSHAELNRQYQDDYERRFGTGSRGGSIGMTGERTTSHGGMDYLAGLAATESQLQEQAMMNKYVNEGRKMGLSDDMSQLRGRHKMEQQALNNMQMDMTPQDYEDAKRRQALNHKREAELLKWKERQLKKKEEHEKNIEKAENEFTAKEKQRQEDAKAADERLSEKFDLKRKVAQGAQQGGASFTGGSAEEFAYITEMQKTNEVVGALHKINEEEKAAKKQLEEKQKALEEKHQQDRDTMINQQNDMIAKIDSLISVSGVR